MRKFTFIGMWYLAAACGSQKGTDDKTRIVATFTGQATNLFATSSNTAPANTANFVTAGLCAGPLQLKLKIFDAAAFLLNPAGATPSSTCDIAADTGNFTCPDVDITDNTIALVGIVEDSGTCVATTASILLPCSTANLQDVKDNSCGNGKWLADHILDQAKGELTPTFAIPTALVQAMDSDLSASAEQATFGSLHDSGAVFNVVLDSKGQPAASAYPQLPLYAKSDGYASRALIPSLVDGGSRLGIDLTAKTTVPGLGMWIAQVVRTDSSGHPMNVTLDVGQIDDPVQSYGVVDCSGQQPVTCYATGSSKPVRYGERGAGTSAVYVVNYNTTSAPLASGNCKLVDAMSAAVQKRTPNASTSLITCP